MRPRRALTPRETAVLTLYCAGWRQAQIADRLGLSAHTVKRHLGTVRNKLNLPRRDRAALLRFAVDHGLLDDLIRRRAAALQADNPTT